MKRFSQAEAMALADRMAPADRRAIGIKTREESERIADAGQEKELQHLCELHLSRLNICFLHISCRAREKAGWPDLTFAVKGTPCAVEMKTMTGRVSSDQQRVLSRLEANGWHCEVIRSFDRFQMFIKEVSET